MERVLRNTAATVSVQFMVDGVGQDPSPDSGTVTITREDGTSVFSGAATNVEPGDGIFSHVLTPTDTATPDLLKLVWTCNLGGVNQSITSYAEVVGNHVFAIAEARQVKPLEKTDYTSDEIAASRTAAELAIELAANVSLVPVYHRAKLNGKGYDWLFLPKPLAHEVLSVEVDGTVVDPATYELDDDDCLWRTDDVWPAGTRNVEVKFVHGFKVPPGRAPHACILLAKHMLVDSPISDRITAMTNDDGTAQYFATAGARGALFSVPEANALVDDIRFVPDAV